MSFDQKQQKKLFNWLKEQTSTEKPALHTSIALGMLGALLIISQAATLAFILEALIIKKIAPGMLIRPLFCFGSLVVLRAFVHYFRQEINFAIGSRLRNQLRNRIFTHLDKLGPSFIKSRQLGSWSTLLIEQIEDIQDFYAHYLPQLKLATFIPLFIVIAIFPVNWAAGVIFCITAPLIPVFMAFVGMGAADINRKNFLALNRLSGYFLNRIKSLETIRIFHQGNTQATQIEAASERFRHKTLDVLYLAFLSSSILEFFASISIALVAVYFGFSYLGELNFGSYHTGVSLFAGFFVLLLAPEFFQPLRDLGTFYHAKAQAVAAAESLYAFLQIQKSDKSVQYKKLMGSLQIIRATNVTVLNHNGTALVGPLSFEIKAGEHIVLVGKSGAGKTSLMNALMGFLPYTGSLTINGIELNELAPEDWHSRLSWVGQNPYLFCASLKDNVVLSNPGCTEETLLNAIQHAYVAEFIPHLTEGLETRLGENAVRLSVGQAQRVAIARALLKPFEMVILDEPTASLDKNSQAIVNEALKNMTKGRTLITITHQPDSVISKNNVWLLEDNTLKITEKIR